jgi:hypothetical protein
MILLEACENVIFARAYNSEHQMELITQLAARFAEEQGVYRLLIVDSIIALFRTDYCGRGELAERQQKLNVMLSRLMKIAEVSRHCTNQYHKSFLWTAIQYGRIHNNSHTNYDCNPGTQFVQSFNMAVFITIKIQIMTATQEPILCNH